jgi:transmembrane sensor
MLHLFASSKNGLKTRSGRIKLGLRINLWMMCLLVPCSEQAVDSAVALISPPRTEPGHPVEIILEDHSRIQLNGNTGVLIKETTQRRDIVLDTGEALFEVRHEDARPFRVTSGKLVVEVLGTQFNMLALPGTVHLSLTEGRARLREQLRDGALVNPEVLISPGSRRRQPMIIEPGDVPDIREGKDGSLVIIPKPRDPAEAQRRMEWLQGTVTFKGESLSEVTQIMNMFQRSRIVIDDPRLSGSIAETQIGGTYRPANLEGFLSMLKAKHIESTPKGPDGAYPEIIYLRPFE